MSLSEWWIDAAIASMPRQPSTRPGHTGAGQVNGLGRVLDDHGKHWSPAIQATPDQLNVPHIMAVTGGPSGTAYVGWLSDSDPRGYAVYLRPFSVTKGWLSAPFQVSTDFGDPSVWPGDTSGFRTSPPPTSR